MSTRIVINADVLPSDAVLETYADGTVWVITPADGKRRTLRELSVEETGEQETPGPFSIPTRCPDCKSGRDASGEFVHWAGCTYDLPDGATWSPPPGDIRSEPPEYTPRHARKPTGSEPALMTIGWPMALDDAGALLQWCDERWPGCQLRPTGDPTLAEIFMPAAPPAIPPGREDRG